MDARTPLQNTVLSSPYIGTNLAPPRIVRGANVTVEFMRGPIPDEAMYDEGCLFIGDDTRNDIEIQGSLASIKAIGEAILKAVEQA